MTESLQIVLDINFYIYSSVKVFVGIYFLSLLAEQFDTVQ